MRFRVLGPLEVWDDGVQLNLGAGRERALLALLVLNRNEVVPLDRIVDALWSEHPPSDPEEVVEGYISQLRAVVGLDTLVAHPWGYGLRAPPGSVDVDEFQLLVERARGEEPAVETLREALALWRGPALADVADRPFAQTEIARLEEARLAAEEEALELSTHGQRRSLAELEPTPEPRPGILAHGPARRRIAWPRCLFVAEQRWKLAAAGAALIAAATIAVVWGVTRAESRHVAAGPNMVAALDPKTNRLVDAFSVGGVPTRLVTGGNAVWVVNSADGTLSRIDVRSRSVRTISVGPASTGIAAPTIAAGTGSVWVSNGPAGVVSRLELQSGEVVRTIELRRGREKAIAGFLAASPTDVWVVGGRVSARRPRPVKASARHLLLWRIDPHTNKVIRAVQLEGPVLGLRPDLAAAVVGDSLWLRSDSGIVRFDRRSGRVRGRLALAPYANVPENGRLATGAGSLWVPDIHNSVVWRVDLATGKRVASIHVRGQPAGVAFGAGAAWLADANTGTILRVDPSTNEVVARISVDGAPSSLAFGFGRVWVAVD